jgi:hypothetical protein
VVAATVAFLLVALGGSWRGGFINPGELSTPHSSEAFAAHHAATLPSRETCAACHSAGASGASGLVGAALSADPGPLDLSGLANVSAAAPTTIDAACQRCHTRHDFHQAVVMENISCSYCHTEHRGPGAMAATKDRHCALCHGDAAFMADAAAARAALPEMERRSPTRHEPATVGQTGRVGDRQSETVFTRAIHGFAEDHPEFRVHIEEFRDPNTLKFNHALHLAGETIPNLPDGFRLDCADCHQPDAAGVTMRPVRFETHCRSCHSLQFDPETPGLHLPHGNPEFVSAFLRSLPRQYADMAAREGITGVEAQNEFAREKLERLGRQIESGEALEKRIFFSTAVTGPDADVGTVSGATRALYPGCVYCHEVIPKPQGRAEVTKPVLLDRWLAHSQFDHSKHATVACSQCHQAVHSSETADVLLPGKATCVTCHSPRGGVTDSCVTCHGYHRQKSFHE